MAETKTAENQEVVITPTNQDKDVNTSNIDPFADSWTEEPRKPEAIVKEEKQPDVIPAKVENEVKDEIIDPDEYIRKELGFENLKSAKEELEKLRASATTKEEIKFANEQSKKLHELLREGKEDDVFQVLYEKNQLEKVEKLDAAKPENAAEILKLSLRLKFKDLSDDEVADMVAEDYSKPEKPEQALDQDEDEYKAQVDKWKKKCDAVDKKMIRDAKMAKPELAKFKAELVLPEIANKQAEINPETEKSNQEALALLEKHRTTYLQSLETDYKKFNGFEVTYEDKEVKIPIAYQPTEDEKSAQLERFKNFDLNDFAYSRWFNKDGTPNINQMQEDVYLLENKGKIFQKIANDAGTKRLAYQKKQSSNIKVNGESSSSFQPDNQTESQKQVDYLWENG